MRGIFPTSSRILSWLVASGLALSASSSWAQATTPTTAPTQPANPATSTDRSTAPAPSPEQGKRGATKPPKAKKVKGAQSPAAPAKAAAPSTSLPTTSAAASAPIDTSINVGDYHLGAGQGTKVTAVTVKGNNRIEKDAIIEKMKIKPGTVLDPALVKADVLSIFSLGFFEDVRMELEGTTLVVNVRERPVIASIKYEGASEFETKDLEEATGLKPFTVLNLSKIRQAEEAISKKYEEKGYYLARADYELRPLPGRPSEIELAFKIQENQRVRIRRIFFFGNKNFTTGDLKQVMITTEGHVFSWATSGGTYREDAFERDLAVLAYFYGNAGYIQAKIAKPRVSLSQDRKYIDILIDVEEGQKYYLGDVKFEGDLLFSEAELRKSFEMEKGEVFSTGKLQEEVLKLTDKYGDLGYAFANVIPRPQIREGSNVVDLTFGIERGEKVYWGKISVTGNTKTHDKVIRRELPFNEGELYNATKRKKGVERVRRLGFFGNDVNFLTSTPKDKPNNLDLEIKVSEKPTGTLNVSAGFATAGGLTLTGQVSQNNLRGLGQQLSVSLSWTQAERNFNLSFTDPKFRDSEWLAGGDLFYQERKGGTSLTTGGADSYAYNEKVYGLSGRVGREFWENWNVYGTYKLSQSLLTDPISTAIFTDPEKDKNSIISSITGTIAYDTRNNRLDPSSGYYFSGSSEFAGLGGRVFQKYLVSARAYRKLFWKFVARTNLEYGLLANAITGESVPDAERFILGGIFSLRGYAQNSVGPSKRITPTRAGAGTAQIPYVIGGTQKLVFNQEIEFPLIPEADIRAALFFDLGNTWDPSHPIGGPAVLANYGWGIRWYSPLGPLRFEWGFPISRRPGDHASEFHFIIAPTF